MKDPDPDNWTSDTSSEYDPFEQYGDDKLARAVEEPDRMRELLSEGVPISAYSIIAAVEFIKPDSLRVLSEARGDVNKRPDDAHDPLDDVAEDWPASSSVLKFEQDSKEWYPIVHAAYVLAYPGERLRQAALMTTLLEAGADIFATYRQPMVKRRTRVSLYPGEKAMTHTEFNEYFLRAEREPSYGVRSALHAILEDSARVDPILNHTASKLDVNHRDPQGRTLFLSMCRSGLGADAATDSVISDAGHWQHDKLPDPLATSVTRPSLFDFMVKLHPDMLAVDYSGKNALHHLLESMDSVNYDGRPPKIRHTLLYLLKHCPSLVNQPDKTGECALHAALQRIRHYVHRDRWREIEDLDCLIEDLLAGGADSHARDARGNTALHYTADEGLGELILGEHTRRRFKIFLELGVDVHARNHDGRTALELFLDDDGSKAYDRHAYYYYGVRHGTIVVPSPHRVDNEVFGLFDKYGAKWNETDAKGRTLLHLVARHKGNDWTRGATWAKRLLAKGVDPAVQDQLGMTAADVAKEIGNEEVLEVLNAPPQGLPGRAIQYLYDLIGGITALNN